MTDDKLASDADALKRLLDQSQSLGPQNNIDSSGNSLTNNVYLASPHEPTWPILVGTPPPLATSFQERADLRAKLEAAQQGTDIVLTPVLSGDGGTGKTQLAASIARQALKTGTDLVVWVRAADLNSLVATFAKAAVRLEAVDSSVDRDTTVDARDFVTWLTTTDRRWLVVLDDIGDPHAIESWWPTSSTGTGRVLATTRRRDGKFTGGGRVPVEVRAFEVDEASTYLRDRLTHASGAHLIDSATPALAKELGLLPLALSHAAVYMYEQDMACAEYLRRFREAPKALATLMPTWVNADHYDKVVATTWALSITAADQVEPKGMATVAVRLAAVLDPDGHPGVLWSTDAVRRYIAESLGSHDDDPDLPKRALHLLRRFGLITLDPTNPSRNVAMNTMTQRAVAEAAGSDAMAASIQVVADALVEAWPADYGDSDITIVFRTNADVLTDRKPKHALWTPDAHIILFRIGLSLYESGLFQKTVKYFQTLADASERILGPDHPETLAARASIDIAYWSAGRAVEPVGVTEQLVIDRELSLGPDHPDTLSARANLASSYRSARQTAEAIRTLERLVADSERVLGADHPETLKARGNLASSYRAGQTAEAVDVGQQLVRDFERIFGARDPNVLKARGNLASSYRSAGQTAEAIRTMEQLVADSERVLGADHPETLVATRTLRSWRGGS